MKNKHIIISGVCRDVGRYLGKVLANISHISSHFRTATVVICESKSTDDTNLLLDNWAQQKHPAIIQKHVLHCPGEGRHRIERIVEARNAIVAFVKENYHPDNFDFLINMDLDEVNLTIEGLETCFDRPDFGAISKSEVISRFAFVNKLHWIMGKTRLTDPFAIRTARHPDNKCSEENKDRNRGRPNFPPRLDFLDSEQQQRYLSGNLVEVLSAFGGFSIYDFKLVYGQPYELKRSPPSMG